MANAAGPIGYGVIQSLSMAKVKNRPSNIRETKSIWTQPCISLDRKMVIEHNCCYDYYYSSINSWFDDCFFWMNHFCTNQILQLIYQAHHLCYRKEWHVMNFHLIWNPSCRHHFRADVAKLNTKWNSLSINHGNSMKNKWLFWILFKRWIWTIHLELCNHLKINLHEISVTLDRVQYLCTFLYRNAVTFMVIRYLYR